MTAVNSLALSYVKVCHALRVGLAGDAVGVVVAVHVGRDRRLGPAAQMGLLAVVGNGHDSVGGVVPIIRADPLAGRADRAADCPRGRRQPIAAVRT